MSTNKNPLVSVLCLSYQHSAYVERCLRSVIAQTFTDFEIVFIDNHSADDSFQKGKRLLEQSNIPWHAFQTAQNLGISGGFNYAVKNLATGKYIATLACDDFWDMYNLEEKVSYFEANPALGLVYGNGYIYYNETAEMVLYYKKPSPEGSILRELISGMRVNPQGILYRKDVLKEMNYWDEQAKVEDRELIYRIARKYFIGYVHKPLTFYRAHKTSISSNLEYMREGNEYYFKKYEEEFPKEVKVARMKQERFFAYVMSTTTPTFKTFFKLIHHYKFNWLYTKEVIRCFFLALKAKFK